MKYTRFFLYFLSIIILASCGTDESSREVDNIQQFKEYIAFTTEGMHSTWDPIKVGLIKPLEQFDESQEISRKYISINPEVPGKLYIENGLILEFRPAERLKPGIEYMVTVHLSALYDSVSRGRSNYTFSFKTIHQDFKINIGNIQSYSREWQYLKGSIESADYIKSELLSKLIKAEQGEGKLHIKWEETEELAKYFEFVIDSIAREADSTQIRITWNGSAIGSENQGSRIIPIPGYNNFNILGVQIESTPKTLITINFSDPIDPDQDFSGLISIENSDNLRFEVNNNVLYVYPSEQLLGKSKLTIFPGIINIYGTEYKKTTVQDLNFQQLKPQIKLISDGVILPSAQSTPLYFKTVSLKAVDVRVIEIYRQNVLQFLQSNSIQSTDDYHINRVGRLVARKTIKLSDNAMESRSWQAHGIKLSELFKADPGSLYRIELSFRQSYSTYQCPGNDKEDNNVLSQETELNNEYAREEKYWNNEVRRFRDRIWDWRNEDNPCHPVYYQKQNFATCNVLGSNLGLIVKEAANNNYAFFTSNLLTAQIEKNVRLELYDYQKQLIISVSTGNNGMTEVKTEKPVAFVIAQSDNNYAYANLDDGYALSMSKFDVSGQQLKEGLKGYLYSDRGVYRPGDTIYLSFVLDDKNNPLPDKVPVELEVRNAKGKLIQRYITFNGKKTSTSKSLNNFHSFKIPTSTTDATGNWRFIITVGGAQFNKSIPLASVKPNRLKIDLSFKEDILSLDRAISGTITGSWLHGAPAKNKKVDVELRLRSSNDAFKDYPDYVFQDPVRKFEDNKTPFLESTLSSQGTLNFSKKIDLKGEAPGMLDATFLTKLYEGGGDFSLDVFTKKLAPYSSFVGIKAPEPNRYGAYYTDTDVNFQLLSVDSQGNPLPHKSLKIQVFRIEWRWWWNQGADNLSEYEDASMHVPVINKEISTDARGKAGLTINILEDRGGRYLIRIIDEESGHASGKIVYFFRNWYGRKITNPDNVSMLVFTADKDLYHVGETAKITFPSSAGGNALISIENGSRILSTRWIKTQEKNTLVEIPLTAEMAPNIYVNITLLQKHDQSKNDRSIRLYGVIPIRVKNPQTFLYPQIDMPDILRPNEAFTMKVSEKEDKPMTYTIAIVDQGLLDLTRFRTPDIHHSFYSREALGVKTFDMYDYVIGAYSGSVNNVFEVGGDDAARRAKQHKANRFKPVVQFLGPFHLNAGQTQSHKIQLPNYIGAVRAMIVAGNTAKHAYGSTDKSVQVKKPLMVLASIPRKLSPGETVTIPVTVFAMNKEIDNVQVKVKTSDALEAIGKQLKNIHFDQVGEQIVNFKFKVKPTSKVQEFHVTVSGNGEKASYDVEFDVFNPNPITYRISNYELSGNDSKTISYDSYGIDGTREVKLTLSTLPPMNFTQHLQYLIHYPHGCVEQTTSSGFPQLYLSDIFDLSDKQKEEIVHNIKATINRIGNAQLTSGALPFWPGTSKANAWATSYAGHFMIEAKQQGYALPIGFLTNWVHYQKRQARSWSTYSYPFNSSLIQAYRLYTLALAGHPELAAMNRLRVSGYLSNIARWRLAAAYALIGKKNVALKIASTATTTFSTYQYARYTFGSPFRNKAMALETMVLLDNDMQRQLAESIARDLSTHNWYSTQETSYALLALSKMVKHNGGRALHLTIQGEQQQFTVQTIKSLATRTISSQSGKNAITINNKSDNIVYINLYQEGKLPIGQEEVDRKNLYVSTIFLDAAEQSINVDRLHQGTEIIAQITVGNMSDENINDLALTQIFPSGWEIINTSFTDFKGGVTGQANFVDIRDNRVHFYLDLDKYSKKTFTVKLNASYLGRYYLPGTHVQAMYDKNFFAHGKGKWVEIY